MFCEKSFSVCRRLFRTLSNICHTPGSFRYFPKAFYKTEVQEKEDNKDESHIGKSIRKNPGN